MNKELVLTCQDIYYSDKLLYVRSYRLMRSNENDIYIVTTLTSDMIYENFLRLLCS